MSGLFGQYSNENAGVGIPKNYKEKNRLKLFFEIFFRKFWKLLGLNLLYFVCCIPVITIGPATAGIVKVLRNYTLEKHSFVISDFFDSFKKNFKKSFAAGMLNIFFLICVYAGYIVYPQLVKQLGNNLIYIPFLIMISIGFTILMMNFYIYPMIVTTDISFKNIIKNSFFLTCIALKKNILTLFITALISILFALLVFIYPVFIILLPFMPLSLIWFIICFNCYPVIQKYVINPYYEERGEANPELGYQNISDNDQTLFEDKGGSEVPVETIKSKKVKKIK